MHVVHYPLVTRASPPLVTRGVSPSGVRVAHYPLHRDVKATPLRLTWATRVGLPRVGNEACARSRCPHRYLAPGWPKFQPSA